MRALHRVPAAAAVLAALALPASAGATSSHGPAARATAHGTTARPLSAWLHRFGVRVLAADADHDGLTNLTEYRARTSPRRADSNGDGVTDAAADADRDGLGNLSEQRAGTDPGRRDSDRDRTPDGREDADRDNLANLAEQQTSNDPGDPDSDDDGVRDGRENAGRVVTFDPATGLLTLRLAATGRLVTGTLGGATDVACRSGEEPEDAGDDSGVRAGDDVVADDDGGGTHGGFEDGAAGADAFEDLTLGVTRVTPPMAGPSDDDEDPSGVAGPAAGDDCARSELEPGAWVHEAELLVRNGATTFEAIALVESA
jgi:hypothetical protein